MKITAFCLLFGFSLPASRAAAQGVSWAAGMWGAAQSCPYGFAAAPGAVDAIDGVREVESRVAELRRELREKKSRLKKIEREMGRERDLVEKALGGGFAERLFDHIDNGRTCEEGRIDDVSCSSDSCIQPFRRTEWDAICVGTLVGAVNATAACRVGRAAERDCAGGLKRYAKSSAARRKLQKEIERLDSAIEEARGSIREARQNALEEAKERKGSRAEGGICWECAAARGTVAPPDWAGVAANVGVGLLGVSMGYQANKNNVANNSAFGWPSQPYPAWGYGLPYLANGIYGALGGGIGAGSFGCGGVQGNFGGEAGLGASPYGMSPMSGGMYLSGGGPWGMNGPWTGHGFPVGLGPAESWPGLGFGAGTSPPGTGFGGVGYQQQMLRMQIQQYQMQMQIQERVLQESAQRQRAALQLQVEISSLMMRLRQFQSPVGGGYLGGGNLGVGGMGMGGGTGLGGSLPPSAGPVTPFPGPSGR